MQSSCIAPSDGCEHLLVPKSGTANSWKPLARFEISLALERNEAGWHFRTTLPNVCEPPT
eukprot:2471709-Karenia_brevis.AAC.1